MAHIDKLNGTLYSPTALTSISSRASGGFYESLKPEITKVEQSQTNLHNLVDAAEKIITKFSAHPRSTYTHGKGSETISSVNLDAVMHSMLAGAEECGGESGKRYVASAIVACGRNGGDEDVVGALAALGTTWLTHFLFISQFHLKTRRSKDETEPDEESRGSFHHDILIREGHTCVITGLQDDSHPALDQTIDPVSLKACHVLRGAFGHFDKDEESDSFKSAAISFDILVNFTRLPIRTIEEFQSHLNDPSNGMLLQRDAHEAFDEFCWCLKRTETEHVYTLKVFRRKGLIRKPRENLVTFRNHSGEFASGSTIPLPNPHYFAIHAAIAGVLHMSGAGKFFDELLDKYKNKEGGVPAVQSWLELEEVTEEVLLRESLEASFQSVKVY